MGETHLKYNWEESFEVHELRADVRCLALPTLSDSTLTEVASVATNLFLSTHLT